MIDPTTVDPMPEQDPFWHRRDVLTHIYECARARRVSPWATLGAAMVRAVAGIPPNVVLPALIGSRTSLNLFLALVGPSGAGKDAAEGVARDAFTWGTAVNPMYNCCDETPVVPLGSGEGISRTFRPHGTKPDDPNPVVAAIFSAPEIDTWAALSARQGSTLTAELRKLFTGGPIGFANAGKDTRTTVAAHSYRACGIFGVQPLRAGPLLAAADGGLPQRLCWLPTSDPDAPNDRPDEPKPLPDPMPDWGTAQWVTISGDQIVLSVPPSARHEIDAHRLAVLRGAPDVDPLDGHALLTRLKVAAALMVLDGQTTITEQDWQLAGTVMAVSTATRGGCQRALDDQSRNSNRARAHAAAERDEIISDRQLSRCKQTIERWIDNAAEGEQIARHDLRRKIRAEWRQHFDSAITQLIEEGQIEEVTVERGTGYRRCTRVHARTRSSTSENDPCTDGTRGPLCTPDADESPAETPPPPPEPHPPPGGVTDHTPGYTDRVQQTLNKVRSKLDVTNSVPETYRRPGCVCIGQPRACYHCGQLASKQQEADR